MACSLLLKMQAKKHSAIRKQSAGFADGAALFKALAHPVRLQIIHVLAQGEACVCHMQVLLGKRQPYISQQLMVLREAGLVEDRRDGAMVYYRLASEEVSQTLTWMEAELARQGHPISLPPVPQGPLEGCPCAQCNEEGCS